MKHDSVNIILAGTYDGYLWMSDMSKPEVFKGKSISDIQLTDKENPFIIEGQLYDASEGVSYSIKYVDGKYIAIRYSELNDDAEYTEKSYNANRMSNGIRLKFRQYWKAQEDEFCLKFEALKPANLVFVGFEKEEDSL